MQEAAATPAQPTSTTIGRRIRRARWEMALDQAEFARRLDVHRQTVMSWEGDKSKPTLRLLERVARLTGKTPGWFIEGVPDEDL